MRNVLIVSRFSFHCSRYSVQSTGVMGGSLLINSAVKSTFISSFPSCNCRIIESGEFCQLPEIENPSQWNLTWNPKKWTSFRYQNSRKWNVQPRENAQTNEDQQINQPQLQLYLPDSLNVFCNRHLMLVTVAQLRRRWVKCSRYNFEPNM